MSSGALAQSQDLHPSGSPMDLPHHPYTVNGAGAAIAAAQSQQLALPPSIQRPIHQLVPEQQHQMININIFTPSCSRCRQKKLKCDTNLPCNQCISKDLDHDCRKDSRIPRGRKRPKTDSSIDHSDSHMDEIASLKQRIRELENAMAEKQHGQTGSPRSECSLPRLQSSIRGGISSRDSATTALSEIDGGFGSRGRLSPTPPSPTSDEEQVDEAERALKTLEKLAASDPRVGESGHGTGCTKQINNVSSVRLPRDRPHAFYSRPTVLQERYDMLVLAKRLVPDKMIVAELMNAFSVRCHHLVGHIIHMPSFIEDITFFNNATIEDAIVSPYDMYDLARYFMVLRLAMRFYPWSANQFADDTSPAFIAVNALKNRGDDISRQWYNLAKKALAADRTFSLGTLKAMQTALLMILDGRDSPTYLRMLLRVSIQTALDMGLHRLGDAMPSDKTPNEDLVRLETAVRIWWYLVVKDWCSAQREGAYTIHPSQMTTRRPLHTTDQRLSEARMDEVPYDRYCEMSYVLSQIQLAHIIRESIDLRNEQSTLGGSYDVISSTNKKRLQVKLESFLNEDLPPFYRLESLNMTPRVISVHRGLLHQQTFDALLKLNRRSLALYSERATCTLLAEQIVSTQNFLRSVCPVIDGFCVNYLHLFGATLTLTISLLLEEGLDVETRNRRREKVLQALSTMRETPGSDRGSGIIETLMREEEKCWAREQVQPLHAAEQRTSRQSQLDLASLTRTIVAQITENTFPTRADTSFPARTDPLPMFPGIDADFATKSQSGVAVGPDESIIPVIASSWGKDFPFCDPCDPTSILSGLSNVRAADQIEYDTHPPQRSYAYSLRPWQEPPPSWSVARTQQNNFWNWALFQGALNNPPLPVQQT